MPVDLDNLCIEPLNDLHVRGAFCCTERSIQNFCRGHLADHNRLGMMKAYVVCERGRKDVLGFYYLLNTSIEHARLGQQGEAAPLVEVDKIGALYLGMIGVHTPVARQGIGAQMMLHAFRSAVKLSEISGFWAMTLDAINDDAVAYYERFDFKRMVANQREMYLPLQTIKTVIAGIDG